MDVKSLTDIQLINDTKTVVRAERRITAEAIKHFYEINRRKLHLKMGYDSLFTMLRKHFGYCEATAYLRKNAVILMQDVPEVIEKIESGEMLVTVAANIQSFLYSEKRSDRAYSREAKVELVEACSGKSVREVQSEFVRRNPEIEKREVVRVTDENHVRVSHSLSNETEAKLHRIKMLWSHIDPNMSRDQLLSRMAEITLDQIDPVRKAARSHSRKTKVQHTEYVIKRSAKMTDGELGKGELRAPEVLPKDSEIRIEEPIEKSPSHQRFGKSSRYVPQADRHAVHDANRESACEFVEPNSGRRCSSSFQLQLDHIVPHSQGGTNDAASLRLFCAAHNRNAWATRRQAN